MKKRKILLGLALAGICAINLASCADNSQKTTKPSEIDVVKEKINFIVEGKVYQSITIENGKVTMPENPTKEGYNFKGWYTDETYQTEFVNSNITTGANVYALFTQITVERFVDGESLGEVAFNNLDDNISAKEGLTLDKWYIDEACTTKYTNQDVDKLYARNMAKVIFNDGYQDIKELLIKPNTKLTSPSVDDIATTYMDKATIKYVDANKVVFDFDQDIVSNTVITVLFATPHLKYTISSDKTNLYCDGIDSTYYQEFLQYPVISIPSSAKYTIDGEEKELPVYSAYAWTNQICEKVIFQDGIKEVVNLNGSNLKEVKLPSTLEILSESFNYSPKIESINLPNGLKAIYDSFWLDNEMQFKGENVGNTITRNETYYFDINIPASVINMSSVPSNLTFEDGSIFYKENDNIYTTVENKKVLVSSPKVVDGILRVEEGVEGIQAGNFAQLGIDYLYLPSTFSFVNTNLEATNYTYAKSAYLYDESKLNSAKFEHSYMYSIFDRLNDCKAVIVNKTGFDTTFNDNVLTGRKSMNDYVSYNDTSFKDILNKVYFIGELDSEGDVCSASNIYLGTEPYGPGYVVYTKVQDGDKFINGNNYYTGEYPYTEANIQKGDYVIGDYYERKEVYSYVLTQDKYSTNRNKYYQYNSETNTYTRKRINVGNDLSTYGDLYEISYNLTSDTVYRYNVTYMVKQDVYKAATVTVGDAVTENTYYELNDNVYSLTTDTSFEDGKTYYLYSGTNYVSASYNVGDEITGEVYSPSYEYTKTEDTVFSNSKAYYVLLTENKDYYSQANVTVGNTVTNNKYYVLNSNNEYVLTEDTTFVEGITYYVKSTFVVGEYVMADDINRGASTLGLYELIDNEYALTTDTIAIDGKTYYQRGQMVYTLIENVNGIDKANITIFYSNQSIASNETYTISTKLAGDKITEAEVLDVCGFDSSTMKVVSITELNESYDFDANISRNLYFNIVVEYNVTGFTYEENSDGNIVVTGFDYNTAAELESGYCLVVIPSEIDGKSVVEIKANAFENNDSIERIIIASSVKVIGEYAFKGASQLKYVNIAAGGLEEVKTGAFLESAIEEVTMPLANLTNIEPYAFKARNLKGFYPVMGEENRFVVQFNFTNGVTLAGSEGIGGYYFTSDFWQTSTADGSHFGILKYVGETTVKMPTAEGSEDTVDVPVSDVQLICIAAGRTIQGSNTPNMGWTNRKNGTTFYPANVMRYEIMEGSYYYMEAPFLGPVSKIHKNAFTDMTTYIRGVYQWIPSSYGLYDHWLDLDKVQNMDSSIFEAGWYNGLTEGDDYNTLVEKMKECYYWDSWCA